MTEVKLVCAGGTARAEVRGALTAGMTGVPVQIQCGSEWDGLIKSFVAMTASRKMAVDIVDDRAVQRRRGDYSDGVGKLRENQTGRTGRTQGNTHAQRG